MYRKVIFIGVISTIIAFVSTIDLQAGSISLPPGACCTAQDVCSVELLEDCQILLGEWLGPTTTCEVGTCNFVPSEGDCCSPHAGIGCNTSECEATICGFDDFCCEDSWDLQCTGEAQEFCEVCGGSGGPTSGPIAIVPTLSQWGMIFMSLFLVAFAVYAIRRRTEY